MGCPFAASTAISNAAPFWFRSVAQTTSPSSSSAVTSARRVRISSLSLAIFRDSNLVPPSSITTQWGWALPASTPAQYGGTRVCVLSGVHAPANDHAVSSLHSDQIASLNQRSSRCKTQRGQSFQAVKTATTRKPYPVPPGQSEAHDTPETTHQHSKEHRDTTNSPCLCPHWFRHRRRRRIRALSHHLRCSCRRHAR